jgi:hypothetical protein
LASTSASTSTLSLRELPRMMELEVKSKWDRLQRRSLPFPSLSNWSASKRFGSPSSIDGACVNATTPLESTWMSCSRPSPTGRLCRLSTIPLVSHRTPVVRNSRRNGSTTSATCIPAALPEIQRRIALKHPSPNVKTTRISRASLRTQPITSTS